MTRQFPITLFFFFNDTATTEIYTLPYTTLFRSVTEQGAHPPLDHEAVLVLTGVLVDRGRQVSDRKSTRLNSSHLVISYAVFCLKKKKTADDTPSGRSSRPPGLAVEGHFDARWPR